MRIRWYCENCEYNGVLTFGDGEILLAIHRIIEGHKPYHPYGQKGQLRGLRVYNPDVQPYRGSTSRARRDTSISVG